MSAFNRIITASAMLIFLAGSISCSRKVEIGPDTIPFVNDLLTESLPELMDLASAAGQKSGPIVVVGQPEECFALSEEFIGSDVFDNIDGHQVCDSLPDFAGERVVALLDYANAPYDSVLLRDGGKDILREITVRCALAAIDTTIGCKALVLSSPVMHEYGSRDVIDLFQRIGCNVPVFSSADTTHSLTKECYRAMRSKNMFTHDIRYPISGTMMTVASESSSRDFRIIPCDRPQFGEVADTLDMDIALDTNN